MKIRVITETELQRQIAIRDIVRNDRQTLPWFKRAVAWFLDEVGNREHVIVIAKDARSV